MTKIKMINEIFEALQKIRRIEVDVDNDYNVHIDKRWELMHQSQLSFEVSIQNYDGDILYINHIQARSYKKDAVNSVYKMLLNSKCNSLDLSILHDTIYKRNDRYSR